jgi:hypothetical protein
MASGGFCFSDHQVTRCVPTVVGHAGTSMRAFRYQMRSRSMADRLLWLGREPTAAGGPLTGRAAKLLARYPRQVGDPRQFVESPYPNIPAAGTPIL